MKVYVERLPVKVKQSVVHYVDGELCYLELGFNRFDAPDEIVTLADYTKQVRKEVCAKIRENAISNNNLEVDMYYVTPQQLYEIEQGENK